MRSKEEALDYRFFPEPDIPVVIFPEEWISEERANLPELPEEKAIRLARELGIDESDARTLVFEEELVAFFEEALSHFEPMSKERGFDLSRGRSRLLHFVLSEVLREWNRRGDQALSSGGAAHGLAHILAGVMDESLSLNQAKEVYLLSIDLAQHPSRVIEEKGFAQVSGEGALSTWIDEVVAENPREVKDFCAGKDRLLGFLVGQVMKKSSGKANPQKVNELIRQKLLPN
jgi:aspartyl-tRNA(Asn)/glutamyl-tRNA(Gln) amidotransferase subunit B